MTKFVFPSSSKTKALQSILAWLMCFCICQCVIFKFESGFSTINRSNTTQVALDGNNSQHLAKMIEFWDGKPFAGADNYIQYQIQRFYLNSSIKQDNEPLLIDIAAYRYPITVPKCMEKQGAFIAVISAADNFEKRETIRQTWLRLLNSSYIGFAFVVALTGDAGIQRGIDKENKEHSDIIQMNHIDHYHNLTLKAVGLLNWVNINCPRISYLLKCDDDVYVNLPNFYAFLSNVSSRELAIYGDFIRNPPQRNVEDKWFLCTEEWPWSSFPLYFNGPSILITAKALSPLLDAAKLTPFFWIDDVYVTGILAEKASVTLYESAKFFISNSEAFSDPCLIRKSVSWTIDSSDEMNASQKTIENDDFKNMDC